MQITISHKGTTIQINETDSKYLSSIQFQNKELQDFLKAVFQEISKLHK